jgi:hypothetical protein
VLWLALVGAPSTGKTPALVVARRLLGGIKAPPDPPVPEEKLHPGEVPMTPWLVNRGISIWYDDLDDWLATEARDRTQRIVLAGAWTGEPSDSRDKPLDLGRRGHRFPESLFGTFRADRLAETVSGIDPSLLSRLLYCWPVPARAARLGDATADPEGARRLWSSCRGRSRRRPRSPCTRRPSIGCRTCCRGCGRSCTTPRDSRPRGSARRRATSSASPACSA